MVGMPVAFAAAACVAGSGIAEARPVRGPVARAERRVWRAQMALERELTRPLGRGRVIEAPADPRAPGGMAGSATEAVVPSAAAAPRARTIAPTPAAAAPTGAGVARTAFEGPLPEPIAVPESAAAAEPAADGTVSVLVRPAESQPARAAEPLLFPGASQP
jgi:hypothetical protein